MSFFASAKSALLSGSTTTNTTDESSNQVNSNELVQPTGSTANFGGSQQPSIGAVFSGNQRSSPIRPSETNLRSATQAGWGFPGNGLSTTAGSVFNNSRPAQQPVTVNSTSSNNQGLAFGQPAGGTQTSTGAFGQAGTGGFGQASVRGFGQPSSGGFGQANTGGFGQASTGTFGQTSSGGFGQANTGGFGQASTGTFGQTSSGGFGQSNTGGFGQASTGTFGQPSSGGFGQANTGGFGHASTGTFGQTSSGGFGQSNTGGFGQASTRGFGQTSSGGFGQSNTGGFGQASTEGSSQAKNNSQSDLPGTIGHMGRVHVYTDRQRGWAVASITGAIRDHGLEELRVRDYWAIRRKNMNQQKLDEIQNTIQQNISMRDAGIIPPPANTIPPDQFVTPITQTQAQPAQTLGASSFQGISGLPGVPTNTAGSTTGVTQLPGSVFSNSGLNRPGPALPTQPQIQNSGVFQGEFGNPTSTFKSGGDVQASNSSLNKTTSLESSQLLILNQGTSTNQDDETEKPKKTAPVFGKKPSKEIEQKTPTNSLIQKRAEKIQILSQPKTIVSNPGSFTYELNKMIFVSKFVDLLSEHNLTTPNSLLDDTDFSTKLFEFLGEYSIHPPTQNVPKFKITTSQQEIIQTASIQIERENKQIQKIERQEKKAEKSSSKSQSRAIVLKESTDSEEEKVELIPKPKKDLEKKITNVKELGEEKKLDEIEEKKESIENNIKEEENQIKKIEEQKGTGLDLFAPKEKAAIEKSDNQNETESAESPEEKQE